MPDREEFITIKRRAGQTLSSVIWLRFKQPMPGLAKRVLDRNPGLASKMPVFPSGTSFWLIVPAKSSRTEVVPIVRAFGTAL